MKKSIIIFMAVMLTSCAGFTSITAPNSVAINQGNFRFVKVVSAETQASYVFGIGGLSQKAKEDVVEKLRIAANLQTNQALADVHIKTTKQYMVFGIIMSRTLTATATVVEFTDSNASQSTKGNRPSTTFKETFDTEDTQNSNIKTVHLSLSEYFSSSSIFSRPESEIRENAYSFAEEIRRDYKNNMKKEAKEKYNILVRYYRKSSPKDSYIGSEIDTLNPLFEYKF